MKNQKIEVKGTAITIFNRGEKDYISLTDIAKYRNTVEPFSVINNWMRSKSTIDFIGLWEKINNPNFNPIEFERFRNEAGNNYFVLSPQRWIEATDAIGIISKSGRYGGTFAHKDIAFEFASWISSEFKLYLITEFQRLKDDENSRLRLEWNLQRTLAKINYRIHTDAIQANLIPAELSKAQINLVYATSGATRRGRREITKHTEITKQTKNRTNARAFVCLVIFVCFVISPDFPVSHFHSARVTAQHTITTAQRDCNNANDFVDEECKHQKIEIVERLITNCRWASCTGQVTVGRGSKAKE